MVFTRQFFSIDQEDWQAFVKWFRSNGGIISSKLSIKVCFSLLRCNLLSLFSDCDYVAGSKRSAGSLLQGANEARRDHRLVPS